MSQREEINRQFKHLLDNDLIEPSSSNFNSPLILLRRAQIIRNLIECE